MSAVLSPLVSEFETKDKEANYTAWLKKKIDRSRKSTKPLISHDQVVAEARALIESKRKKHAAVARQNAMLCTSRAWCSTRTTVMPSASAR
jgi:ABC-type Fe3+-citrate transport system substrate-binding protein